MNKYTGKRLDGQYEIYELLGVGGMAFVYRAYDRVGDRIVAIKILKDEFLSNAELLKRFRNESKAIAVLSHPNIVRVYDVSFGDKLQYIVMEYIEGVTLKDYISRKSKISWKEAVHFTLQILRALEHAHERGIVHRDIKPQNIMLLKDGTIKVTDFGIARFTKNETRTMTDKAIGSVHYIAPEQARGDVTDAKSDIYSLGIMLYEMLTGVLPFEADNAVSVAIMQLQTNPEPPRKINADIPEGLEEITLKAMQKSPNKRYHSAAEMLNDIEVFKRNPSIKFEYKYVTEETPSRYVDVIDSINSHDDTESKVEEKEKPTKRSKLIAIGAGIAFLLMGLIFLIMMLMNYCGNTVNDVEIPNFIGMQYSDILKAKEAGVYRFNFIEETTTDESKNDGEVLDQNPRTSANKKVKSNADIKLTVNVKVSSKVTVPDVKGMKEAEAVAKLKSVGLVPLSVAVVDDDTAAGVVKNTDPSVNANVEVGSTVNIYVGKGPADKKTSVPNVINDSVEVAKKKIESAGLKIGNITQKNSKQDKDIVLESDPLPTTPVSIGFAVNLVISSGKQKEKTEELHVKLPSDIKKEVSFKVYINGELNVAKILVPAYNSYYTVSVTGNSGVSTVVVQINNQEYWTYYVDFDDGGKITDQKNENFVFESTSSENVSSSVVADSEVSSTNPIDSTSSSNTFDTSDVSGESD